MGKARKNIPREKIALAIFILFLALAGFFVCSYFLFGKQLNTTATVVDEATGNMEDYSLMVFAGIGEEAFNSDNDSDTSSKGEDAYAASLGQDAADALHEALAKAYLEAGIEDAILKDHVFVSEVRDEYELKGADVSTINLGDLRRYVEPTIVDSGKRKFGIFSARSYISRARLKSYIEDLRSRGAQSIICIASGPQMLSSCNGIDAMISVSEIDADDASSLSPSTLIVENPKQGNVGVIFFSETNAISYKVVKTL